jgi:hypothetical protein
MFPGLVCAVALHALVAVVVGCLRVRELSLRRGSYRKRAARDAQQE